MADVISEAEAAAVRVGDEHFDTMLKELKLQAGNDPVLWEAAKNALEDAGYPPKPEWLTIHDMFSGTVHCTEDSALDITVITHGAKNAALLDVELFELSGIQRKVDDLLKAAEKTGKEPDYAQLAKFGARATELGNLKMAAALFGVITDWSGPLFKFRTKFSVGQLIYDEGLPFPKPSTISLTDPATRPLALEILRQLPDKVVSMVQESVKYMNGYGMTGKVRRGN